MADNSRGNGPSMSDRLLGETNNGKISGWFKGAFAPIVKAAEEQTEALKSMQKYMEKNTKPNKAFVDLLNENRKSLDELAESGNKNAQEIVKLMDSELKVAKETMAKIEAGDKVSQKDANFAAKTLAKLAIYTEKSGAILDTSLSRILEANLKQVKDTNLNDEDRRKSVSATLKMLEANRDDLSHNAKEVLDQMKAEDYDTKNLTSKTVESFEKQVNALIDIKSVLQKKVSAPLQKLTEFRGGGITGSKGLLGAYGQQSAAQAKNKNQPGFYDKSGIGTIIGANKAGFADAILAQLGLGGMGIGKFITDSKRLNDMWESLVKTGNGLYKTLKALPGNIKDGFEAVSSFSRKTVEKIKSVSLSAWDGLTDFGNKLKTTGSDLFDGLTKQTKSIKNFTKTLFSDLGDGFKGFWNASLKAMGKGGSFLMDLLKGGLNLVGGGLGGALKLGGGLLKSGAGMLGGAVLGGGKMLGKGLLGGGKMLAKGLGKLGKVGGGALGGILSAGVTGFGAYQDYQEAKANGASPEELRKIKGSGIAATVGSGVGGAVGGALGALTGPLAPLLIPVFSMLGSTVGEWLGKKIYSFLDGGGAKKIMDGVKKGIDYLFGDDGLFTNFKNWVVDLTDKFSWDSIKDVFSSITKGLSDFLGVDAIKDSIGKAIQGAKDLFSTDTIMDGIKSFVTAMFDGVKAAIYSLLPGASLGAAAVGYLKDWFKGTSSPTQTSDVPSPGAQSSNPTPMGTMPTLDTAKTKQLASTNMTAQSTPAAQQSSASTTNVVSGDSNNSRQSAYRPTKIDDVSLATLNSTLFE